MTIAVKKEEGKKKKKDINRVYKTLKPNFMSKLTFGCL